jgi:trans-aconitate 2-methyltransferase
MANWSPDLYLKFNAERTQPASDLVTRISLDNPRRIIDLGCGPGNTTSLLRDRWPDAEVAGLDNSTEMLAKAAGDWPEGPWLEGDIGSWLAKEPYDLVFTNARCSGYLITTDSSRNCSIRYVMAAPWPFKCRLNSTQPFTD